MKEASISILAVDDDPDLCSLTKAFLETFDSFRVDMTFSVRDAMAILSQRRYDAIVSDYQMPAEDGIFFLKELRSRKDRTPFILFTGKGREEIVIEAIDSGADAYVQKGGETRSVFSELAHKIRVSVAKSRAETGLKESETRYRSLIDGSPVGIFLTDTKFDCTYANRRWLEMISQTEEGALGKEWVHGVPPEDRESFKLNWRRSIECDGEYSFEYRYVTEDQRTKWILGKVVPLKEGEGSVTGYMSTNVDITDRKRMESDLLEKERTLVKASSLAKIGYWTWSAEKGYIAFSEGLSQLLGLKSETAPQHDLFFEMVHPDDRMRVIEALEGALKGKGDLNIEHRMVRSDWIDHHCQGHRGGHHRKREPSTVSVGGCPGHNRALAYQSGVHRDQGMQPGIVQGRDGTGASRKYLPYHIRPGGLSIGVDRYGPDRQSPFRETGSLERILRGICQEHLHHLVRQGTGQVSRRHGDQDRTDRPRPGPGGDQ